MKRQVNRSRKDADHDIVALCGAPDWSPRLKADVIRDIETMVHSYFVLWTDGISTDVRVVNDRVKGKYLRTDRDNTTRNNLDDLPDC